METDMYDVGDLILDDFVVEEHNWYMNVQEKTDKGWFLVNLNQNLSYNELMKIDKWLVDTYGAWDLRHNDEVLLPSETEAVWFKLKWA